MPGILKLVGIAIGLVGKELNAFEDNGRLISRRYTDLLQITLHYNPDFDERKYWAYGCNCLMLGNIFHRQTIFIPY